MSRRFPRIRAKLSATVQIEGTSDVLVCRTRDISLTGCFLDTGQLLDPGLELSIALMDAARGEVIEVYGRVTRCLPPGADGVGRGVGVVLPEPPDEWTMLVERHKTGASIPETNPVRLRVLVVGDDKQRRGALALYVTSGWDVRFASDLDGAIEALDGVRLNAVIAENELSDQRWEAVLSAARRMQPSTRRIVRCHLDGEDIPDGAGLRALVHRFVDRGAGLDALLDALTADMGSGVPLAR